MLAGLYELRLVELAEAEAAQGRGGGRLCRAIGDTRLAAGRRAPSGVSVRALGEVTCGLAGKGCWITVKVTGLATESARGLAGIRALGGRTSVAARGVESLFAA
jgi:hypothetical protein